MNLIKADLLVAFGILLAIGAHVTTIFLVGFYTDAAAEVVQRVDVIKSFEANPAMGWVLALSNVNQIFAIILRPALLVAFWVAFRIYTSKTSKNSINQQMMVWQTATVLFIMFLIDFSHDLALALGLLAGNGFFG